MNGITPVVLVHGGAGSARGGTLDEQAHHGALREALDSAWERLEARGSALDAAEAAVHVLEDCDLFNAGRGAVPTAEGRVEMDAAVMDGAAGTAGACAGISGVRHPVSLARSVMETTPHVLLVGAGAEAHADAAGLERREPSWFAGRSEAATVGPDAAHPGHARRPDDEHGTVGAVALDAAGRLAAATSTGGVRGQLPGRVGDSPVIGAGTWADDRVAVSCTGSGEHFIRVAAAHEIAARVRHAGQNLSLATSGVLAAVGAGGGLIALGADGSWSMPFNTELMFRGHICAGSARTWIWQEEKSHD